MVLSSWQRHCQSSTGSLDECRTAPKGSVADTRFVKGGNHGERAEREPKRGSAGGGAPSGVRGWGQGRVGEAPLKLKAFCTFLYKKVAKS